MSINVQVSPSPNVNISVGAGGNLLNLTPLGYTLHANTHISGGIDAINHNFLLGLQGGENNQYYHLNSGQYVNLNNIISSTGTYTLHSETGAFYASSNPSGFITGINNIVYDFGNQNISGIKNFYLRPTVNGSGVLLDGESLSIAVAEGISGVLQGQITVLNNQTGDYTLHSETGAFYAASNPSGFITGINNLVFTTGSQTINGLKTFADNLNASLITSTGADFYLSGKNNAIQILENSYIGGFVNLKGGSGSLVGGFVDLKGGDNAGIIRIQGGNGILENANLPVGQVLLSSFSTEFNRFNNYSSNVVFWKTGLSTMVENARVSQDSISINNNLLITGNRPIVNGTGILLSGEATTQSYVIGISGNLQTQINTLHNQTGNYVLKSNTGQFLTTGAADNRYVDLTNNQTIYGTKNFSNDVYINHLYVTGSETIVSTTSSNVQAPYLILNLTGGATDGGIFFVTGSGLTGIYDKGPIIGFDHSDKFVFGVAARHDDLSSLNHIASEELVTGLSGYLQPQIINLNNATGNYVLKSQTGLFITTSQTGAFYASSNPSGFITGVNLSSYITTGQTGAFYASSNPSGFITGIDLSLYATNQYVTGISGSLQTQITVLNNQTGNYAQSNQTVYITGNQTISGIKTFSNNLIVNSSDLFVNVSTNRVGIATSIPNTTLDVNGTGLFRSGIITSGNADIVGNLTISGQYNIYQEIEKAKILAIAYAIAL